MFSRQIFATLLLIFAASCSSTDVVSTSSAPSTSIDCTTPVSTGNGPVLGHPSRTRQTCAYLGIRYAEAPVGDLRFANPRPAAKHAGTYVASKPGNACLHKFHLDEFGFDVTLATGGEEDCLFLNIWSPGGEQLPVMVYIHGGAFVLGTGNTYNGELLAQEGAVVVTLNYRLGPLGFLYYPSLITEGGSAGNQGILDQILALEWVQQNIAAFGGDPANITIFGESAGAMSVCTLVASPAAKGLFHAAIMQSGGCEVAATAETGYARAVSYAADTGCAAAADPLACMRALPADELMTKMRFGPLSSALEPHIDGKVLTDSPLAVIRSGNFNRVPLLAGSNANEVQVLAIADPHYLALQTMPWSEYYQALHASFPKAEAEALAALYGSANFKTPFDAWFALKSDYILSCPSLIAPQAVAAQGIPAYHYLFSWQELGTVARLTGSFHGLDLFFVFGNFGMLNTVISFDDIADAIELSASMRKFWTAFARTHVPAAPGQPVWPEVASGTMVLDTERSVDADVKRAACKFWDGRMPMGLENQTADFNNLNLPHAH